MARGFGCLKLLHCNKFGQIQERVTLMLIASHSRPNDPLLVAKKPTIDGLGARIYDRIR